MDEVEGGGWELEERQQVQAVFLPGDLGQDGAWPEDVVHAAGGNNSPEKQYGHRPLAGTGCQDLRTIVLLPPRGPVESRPLAG